MKTQDNIYRGARMRAARNEPMFSCRERAAEALYVSTEALKDYETGKTLPPCDVVQRMIEIYGDPDLKRQHIRLCCPMLPDYGSSDACGLMRAALKWAVEADDMRELAVRFAKLAQDGKISPDELEAAHDVKNRAVSVRQAMEESITAIDTALREVQQ